MAYFYEGFVKDFTSFGNLEDSSGYTGILTGNTNKQKATRMHSIHIQKYTKNKELVKHCSTIDLRNAARKIAPNVRGHDASSLNMEKDHPKEPESNISINMQQV